MRGSPVSDDGRGLKPYEVLVMHFQSSGSPVSDDGRGLKQIRFRFAQQRQQGSPVSDDGRGLKLKQGIVLDAVTLGFARQ